MWEFAKRAEMDPNFTHVSGIFIDDSAACFLDVNRIHPCPPVSNSHGWAQWENGEWLPFHICKLFASSHKAKEHREDLVIALRDCEDSENGLLCCKVDGLSGSLPYPQEHDFGNGVHVQKGKQGAAKSVTRKYKVKVLKFSAPYASFQVIVTQSHKNR